MITLGPMRTYCLLVSICLLVIHAGSARAAVAGREITNSIGLRFAFIPPGKFLMGSPESEPDRERQETRHAVELTRGFYLGRHEITVGQFREFVRAENFRTAAESDGKGAYGVNEAGRIEQMRPHFTWANPGFPQGDDHPVVNVSWHDAKAFCRWLSNRENRAYRLPTEAEWEYACRAGTTGAFAGDLSSMAWIESNSEGKAHAVKTRQPNAWGLHDLHGNAWEWCRDWYGDYSTNALKDPSGPSAGSFRCYRGGSRIYGARRARSAIRGAMTPEMRGDYLGFRPVLLPPR